MAFKISSKILKAIDFNSFIACYSIFLTSILQSQHEIVRLILEIGRNSCFPCITAIIRGLFHLALSIFN